LLPTHLAESRLLASRLCCGGHIARERLRDTPEGDGSMLDRTLVLWRSAQPQASHSTKNYPIQLAGGGKLGLKHGYLHEFVGAKKVPLANDAQCRRCSRQIFRR